MYCTLYMHILLLSAPMPKSCSSLISEQLTRIQRLGFKIPARSQEVYFILFFLSLHVIHVHVALYCSG